MFRDDYVLRHIRLFVQAIAKVLGLIKEGDFGFALEAIRLAFNDLLGMSLDDFLAYPDDRLRDFLYFGELSTMGINRVGLASGLLLQAGRVYAGMGDPVRAQTCFEKSARLLLDTILADEEDPDLPEFSASIGEILEQAPLDSFSPEVLAPLSFYFDRSGDLGQAHAAIQALVRKQPDNPDVLEMARSFYEYVLGLDELPLSEGLDRTTAQNALDVLTAS